MTTALTAPAITAVAPPRAADVRLTGLSKRYGDVTALKPLDLVIEAGTLVTLLGPSGCGKTTLLRLIAGLETATSGTIAIGGRDVTNLTARDRNVSMVFQSYALFPHMSVRDNVLYGLQSLGTPKAEAAETVRLVLEQVGLKGLSERAPHELSGGQQQRVALARALVMRPEVLLFDEPLSNLDARLRRQMRTEIRSLQQRLGITVVYVTHDQSEAMAVSDRIIVMRNAEIAEQGSPDRLYTAPQTAFVAAFMGEANLVEAAVTHVADGVATVAVEAATIAVPHQSPVPHPAKLVLRPEALGIADSGSGLAGALPGRILASVYMGSHNEYQIETPAGILLVFDDVRRPRRAVDSTVDVVIDGARAVIVAA
jgi:iron(III) transport system ATP-binding protein